MFNRIIHLTSCKATKLALFKAKYELYSESFIFTKVLSTNYYIILGVTRSATEEEIKKAYRSKAKLYHPDVNKSAKANELFQLINEAQDVLLDEHKRAKYDLKLKYGTTSNAYKEKARQYEKPKSQANPSYQSKNFHYDWQSINKTFQNRGAKQNPSNASPLMQFLFYTFGLIVGIIIISICIWAISQNIKPFVFIIVAIPGVILVRDGWNALNGNKTITNKLKEIFKSLF